MNMISNPNEIRAARNSERSALGGGRRARRERPTGSSSTRSGPPACTAGRPARRAPPRPENVAFHATAAEAERAGFRPCKRCKPDQPPLAEQRRAMVAELCRFIEAPKSCRRSTQLAERAGLSALSLSPRLQGGHRPHAARPTRRRTARSACARSWRAATPSPRRSTTPATTPAAASTQTPTSVLGMTPTAIAPAARTPRSASPSASARSARSWWRRASGASARSRSATIPTRWRASCRTASRARADRRRRRPSSSSSPGWWASSRRRRSAWTCRSTCAAPRSSSACGRRCARSRPAATASYAEIAERIGAPKAVRAVAQACGANPLAVAIPCHRVVRSDGALSGYRWGVERKRALLERGRRRMTRDADRRRPARPTRSTRVAASTGSVSSDLDGQAAR